MGATAGNQMEVSCAIQMGAYKCHAAGMIERHNGLLKSGLKSDINSLRGWSARLWTMLRRLNERPQKGALSPVDMLTHMAASPIQLPSTDQGRITEAKVWLPE